MKEKTKFVCGECGYETVKWMGCCPMCGSWNTLVEVSAAPEKRSTHSAGGTSSRAVTLGSVIYRIIIAEVLELGMPQGDLKLISSVIVALAIAAPALRERAAFRRRRAQAEKGGATHA